MKLKDTKELSVELATLPLPSPLHQTKATPSSSSGKSRSVKFIENPLRSSSQDEEMADARPEKGLLLVPSAMCVLMYIVHCAAGPLGISSFPIDPVTGCITSAGNNIYSSWLKSFSLVCVFSSCLYFACRCTFLKIRESGKRQWLLASFFFTLVVMFAAFAKREINGDRIPTCKTLPPPTLTSFPETSPSVHFWKGLGNDDTSQSIGENIDIKFWMKECRNLSAYPDDIIVSNVLFDHYGVNRDDFITLVSTMMTILKVIAPGEVSQVLSPFLSRMVCLIVVFPPSDKNCHVLQSCPNMAAAIVDDILSGIGIHMQDLSLETKRIVQAIKNDNCRPFIEKLNEFAGGNLRGAIPVLNMPLGVEEMIFKLIDSFQDGSCNAISTKIYEGIEVEMSPRKCFQNITHAYAYRSLDDEGRCNPRTFRRVYGIRQEEVRVWGDAKREMWKRGREAQDMWIKGHFACLNIVYCLMFIATCYLVLSEDRASIRKPIKLWRLHSKTTMLCTASLLVMSAFVLVLSFQMQLLNDIRLLFSYILSFSSLIALQPAIKNILMLDIIHHDHRNNNRTEQNPSQNRLKRAIEDLVNRLLNLKRLYRKHFSVSGDLYLLKAALLESFEISLQFVTLKASLASKDGLLIIIFAAVVVANGLISPVLLWARSLDGVVITDTVFDLIYTVLNVIRLTKKNSEVRTANADGMDLMSLIIPIYAISHRIQDYSKCLMREREALHFPRKHARKATSGETGNSEKARRRSTVIGVTLPDAKVLSQGVFNTWFKVVCSFVSLLGLILSSFGIWIVYAVVNQNAQCKHLIGECVWNSVKPKIVFGEDSFKTDCVTSGILKLDLSACSDIWDEYNDHSFAEHFPRLATIEFKDQNVKTLPRSILKLANNGSLRHIYAQQSTLPRNLDLSYMNLLSFPPSLTEMIRTNRAAPSLEVLNVSNNKLDSDSLLDLIAAFANTTSSISLRVIDLSSNFLTSPIDKHLFLGSFPNLREIDLSDNHLTKLGINEAKWMLPPKRTLRFRRNPIQNVFLTDSNMEAFPVDLFKATAVSQLSLYRLLKLKGEIPRELILMRNLSRLELARIPNLIGTLPRTISKLSKLTGLLINKCRLTGTLPSQIGLLEDLMDITMDDNQLTGSLPSQLFGLTRLTRLHGWSNRFNGTIPTEVGNLKKIPVLRINSNLLSGTLPTELGKLELLEELILAHNKLTGTIPRQFGRLTKLRKLDLWNNSISLKLPTELNRLTGLEYFRLNSSENQINQFIPS